MGASGFVGSHVMRKLVERGDDVRVYLRKSSETVAIDDLDVERCYGDLCDKDALRAAMADRDDVYYCIVDTRFHLRDPKPLFETNVECLQRVLDVATDADLHRFVFCSTIGTDRHRRRRRLVTEDMPFNWPGKGGPYLESRRAAEELVLRYVRERALPAVVMNVSNPYGPRDWQPSQGLMVRYAASARSRRTSTACPPKSSVSKTWQMRSCLPARTAASGSATSSPRASCPCGRCWRLRRRRSAQAAALRRAACVMYAIGGMLSAAAGRVLRRDMPMNVTGVRLLHIMSPADHGKATRELGWQPRPTAESIRKAARFYVEQTASESLCPVLEHARLGLRSRRVQRQAITGVDRDRCSVLDEVLDRHQPSRERERPHATPCRGVSPVCDRPRRPHTRRRPGT